MTTPEHDEPLVLAIDSSTTATKAIIVDQAGLVLSTGKRDIPMHTPAPGFFEHDPLDWWRTTDEAARAALASIGDADRARVAAMCVTAQRQSFGLFRADGVPLRPAPLWLDSRAADQVKRLGSERIHNLSGQPPDVTPSLYKLAWLKEHEPDTLEAAYKVVGVHGYIAFRLTGEWLESTATADSLGLFDMARLQFADELLDIAGVSRGQMASLVAVDSVLGNIKPDIAESWGLPRPIPLIAGCGDGQAAGLGAGAVGPDEAYLNMGTAIVMGVHSASYRCGSVYRTDVAGLPGHYVLEAVQNSGAYLAQWFRENLGDATLGGEPDRELDAQAAAAGIGAGGLVVLPYWNSVQSPHWDPLARGAIVGLTGGHSRGHIYRAILEGLSLETARNLRSMQQDSGTAIRRVMIMGGGQRSPLWRQIMADVIGLPLISCVADEISALGAAIMAMSMTGVHGSAGDIAAAARVMARTGDVCQPDLEAHRRYTEIGEIQGELYDRLKGLFPRLHALSA